MDDFFVALPVNEGDAFFYHRHPYNILVDGGKSATALPRLIDEHIKVNHLDIVVCTHNDIDHSKGIIGLLKSWVKPIHEIWLPGSWTLKLYDLIANPKEFFLELRDEIFSNPGVSSWEAVAEQYNSEKLLDTTLKPLEPTWIADALGELSASSSADISLQNFKLLTRELFFVSDFPKANLFDHAIKMATKIREISILAHQRGICIRWFDFEEFKNRCTPSGGKSDVLVPVNACEIAATRRDVSALQALYLSLINQQSLVFSAPENAERAGVLFTADSDLSFGLPQVKGSE
jgi:hypothetical protein